MLLPNFKYTNDSGDRQAYLDFCMDVKLLRCSTITNRIEENTILANWTAWHTEPLNVIRAEQLLSLSPVVLYQVSTVLVSYTQIVHFKIQII